MNREICIDCNAKVWSLHFHLTSVQCVSIHVRLEHVLPVWLCSRHVSDIITWLEDKLLRRHPGRASPHQKPNNSPRGATYSQSVVSHHFLQLLN